MGFLKSPKLPPPAPLPERGESVAVGLETRRRFARRKGRASTILTGANELNIGTKTTLGS